MVLEEDQNTPIRASKRVKEASQLSLEPLKSPICKSENKRMNKKTVVKGGKMKTSLGFTTKNEMRGKINQVTEDINKKPNSPKEVPYKETEEAARQ